jgi:hypothetical protein
MTAQKALREWMTAWKGSRLICSWRRTPLWSGQSPVLQTLGNGSFWEFPPRDGFVRTSAACFDRACAVMCGWVRGS